MIHDASVATRVGLPWFQMGYLPDVSSVQWSKGKALNVLLFPGPEAWRSQEMVAGFRQAIKGSAINSCDTPGAITTLKCNEPYSRNAGAPSGRW